ncbi:glycosaminoglycan xylosylkinase-like [Ostrea edulis]|uniref:glycosaminoglycan xylosylkinase-like n=1 Tax=Ostrea edulis TaxID=37623 RepID=UPI002094E3D4|nr:glycosaminoglycan xylosylkinase-like [Ostrea edulis]XP_048777829.1 glycosaminoglycan xylosylkinase-like [Ostrea edulis]
MRRKWRVLVGCMVIFILFVSYKILEPDIKGKVTQVEADSKGLPVAREDNSDAEEVETPRDPEEIVKELRQKYWLDFSFPLKDSPWRLAERMVNDRKVHPEYVPELGSILREMATRKIVSADTGYKGTQLKLSLILEGGQVVAFKPKWYRREDIFSETPYSGADRHNGEIAAFHLNRIMEFRRTPLVVGRKINLKSEIIPNGSEQLLKTFFVNGSDTCFYGKCYYCKGKETGVCAEGDTLEGSVILWLPKSFPLKTYRHPWARTYNPGKQAQWEKDPNYCSAVKAINIYSHGPRLFDLIDTAIFDFLIGNADRHRYETLGGHLESAFLLLDNGKSFGNPFHDEISILAPLYQCCVIRYSTYKRLLLLRHGVLSRVLRNVLRQDPIAPILTEEHYQALDRRLEIVLEKIQTCLDNSPQNRGLVKNVRS